MKTSFCLITLNEEQNLPRCLKSCAGLADEIIVLDSGSTDATEKIAREFGARFERQNWLGYVGQKNKVLSLASHEWIFSLDADEELSPELREEIRLLKSAGEIGDDIAGFSMPRCVFYEGRWIRHGDWYPDRLVRWFRHDRAKFAGGRVHERLEISGRVVPLAARICFAPRISGRRARPAHRKFLRAGNILEIQTSARDEPEKELRKTSNNGRICCGGSALRCGGNFLHSLAPPFLQIARLVPRK